MGGVRRGVWSHGRVGLHQEMKATPQAVETNKGKQLCLTAMSINHS